MNIQKYYFNELSSFVTQKLELLKEVNLNLRGKKIDDQAMQYLAFSLHNCQNLLTLELYLSKNLITYDGANNLGISIAQCSSLTSLTIDLWGCQINDQSISNLISQISRCKLLTTLVLDLRDNQFLMKDLLGIENLIKLTNLTMNLSGNIIYLKGIMRLGTYLEKCKNLKLLNLNLQKEIKQQQIEILSLAFQLSYLEKLSYFSFPFDFSKLDANKVKQQFYNLLMRKNTRLVKFQTN
ncbi:hypothetical protein ABPG72_017422 [Tetrahymena utriculariae]